MNAAVGERELEAGRGAVGICYTFDGRDIVPRFPNSFDFVIPVIAKENVKKSMGMIG